MIIIILMLISPDDDPLCMGNIIHSGYCYTKDLLNMETTATRLGPKNFIPASPLHIPAWESALKTHPDQAFVAYIISGMKCGFRIGADRANLSLKLGRGNIPSDSELVEEKK